MITDTFHKLGIPVDLGSVDVNPLVLAEHHFFSKPHDDGKIDDYRSNAVNLCIEKRISFNSTTNNAYPMSHNFIQIKCPLCGGVMKTNGGGGSGNHTTIRYKCPNDGMKSSITIPDDGINFDFNDVTDSVQKI
jgi:hypothetical protein